MLKIIVGSSAIDAESQFNSWASSNPVAAQHILKTDCTVAGKFVYIFVFYRMPK